MAPEGQGEVSLPEAAEEAEVVQVMPQVRGEAEGSMVVVPVAELMELSVTALVQTERRELF